MTFLKGQMAFTSCILFTSETSEQNTTSKGHLALKKRSFNQVNQLFIVLSAQNIHEFYNECRTCMSLLFQGFMKPTAPSKARLSWPLACDVGLIISSILHTHGML